MLFISLVWPERSSSAAGVRTSDLIKGCRQWGWDVAYLSPAARNEHTAQLEESGVRTLSCQMNRLVHALGMRMLTACNLLSQNTMQPFQTRRPWGCSIFGASASGAHVPVGLHRREAELADALTLIQPTVCIFDR